MADKNKKDFIILSAAFPVSVAAKIDKSIASMQKKKSSPAKMTRSDVLRMAVMRFLQQHGG